MNTDTGELRVLQASDQPTAQEVELSAEEAEIAQAMAPADRIPWWERIHGRIGGGKSRKAAHPAPGTKPHVPQAVARTLATGDHHKARSRKATKASRRSAQPHVKRHARSRAHRGHGK